MNTLNEEKNREWVELKAEIKKLIVAFEEKEKRHGPPSAAEVVKHSLQLKELVKKLSEFEGNS